MKWQFQKETHARQDKIKKPDYREELALDGDNYDRGGSERRRDKPFFVVGRNWIKFNVTHPGYKTDAQRYLEHVLRRDSIFKINGYIAGLGWGKKTFRSKNQIDQQRADEVFDDIISDLEEMFKFTINALRRVERETGYDMIERNGVRKLHYKFKSGLVPVKIGNLEPKKFVFDIDFINAKEDFKQR